MSPSAILESPIIVAIAMKNLLCIALPSSTTFTSTTLLLMFLTILTHQPHLSRAQTCGLLTNIGGLFPEGSLYRAVHSRLSYNCSLNPRSGHAYRSSDIVFAYDAKTTTNKNEKQFFDRSRVHLIDEYTAQLRIDDLSERHSGKYYCFVGDEGKNNLVCTGELSVGYSPTEKPVEAIRCIYTYQSRQMDCTWSAPINHVRPVYQLVEAAHHQLESHPYCESAGGCEWSQHLEPQQEYHLILYAANPLGHTEAHFKFKLTSIVQLSSPERLSFDQESGTLSWDNPPEFTNLIEGDTHSLLPFIKLLRFRIIIKDLTENHFADAERTFNFNYTRKSVSLSSSLKPYTRYQLSIACKLNDPQNLNWSPSSSLVTRTKEGVPLASPEIYREAFESITRSHEASRRSATIYWTALPDHLKGAKEVAYLISYKDASISGKPQFLSRNITTNLTRHTFEALSSADIEFCIYSTNVAGLSSNCSRLALPATNKLLPLPSRISVHALHTITENAYTVEWEKPEQSTSVALNYTVFWCLAASHSLHECGGDLHWQAVIATGSRLVLNLARDNYRFGISMSNSDHSASSGIAWSNCIIDPDKKVDRLIHLSLRKEGSTEFLISWDFFCHAQQKLVKNLYIEYCPTGAKQSKRKRQQQQECLSGEKRVAIVEDTSVRQYLLENLKPHSQYKFYIHAPNVQDTKTLYGETEHGTPVKPFDFEILEFNTSTAQIRWNFTSADMLDHFKIRSPHNETWNIPLSNCTGAEQQQQCLFSITYKSALKPYTNYNISVASCNEIGACSRATQVAFQTEATRPGKMTSPRLETLSNDQFRLYLKPPRTPNGPINAYRVSVVRRFEKNASNVVSEYSFPGSEPYADIDAQCSFSLHDESLYKVSISAINQVNGIELVGEPSEWAPINVCTFNLGTVLMYCAWAATLVAVSSIVYFLAIYLMKLRRRKQILQIKVECNLRESEHQQLVRTEPEPEVLTAKSINQQQKKQQLQQNGLKAKHPSNSSLFDSNEHDKLTNDKQSSPISCASTSSRQDSHSSAGSSSGYIDLKENFHNNPEYFLAANEDGQGDEEEEEEEDADCSNSSSNSNHRNSSDTDAASYKPLLSSASDSAYTSPSELNKLQSINGNSLSIASNGQSASNSGSSSGYVLRHEIEEHFALAPIKTKTQSR